MNSEGRHRSWCCGDDIWWQEKRSPGNLSGVERCSALLLLSLFISLVNNDGDAVSEGCFNTLINVAESSLYDD